MEIAESLIEEGAPREASRNLLKLWVGNLQLFYPQQGLLTLIIKLRNLIAQNHPEVKIEGKCSKDYLSIELIAKAINDLAPEPNSSDKHKKKFSLRLTIDARGLFPLLTPAEQHTFRTFAYLLPL